MNTSYSPTVTKPASTRARKTARPPALASLTPAEVVRELVDRYQPKLHRSSWAEARDFVKDVVATTALASDRDPSRLMRVAAPFVMWCIEEHGLDLRAELIFSPTLINRYCTTKFTKDGTGGTYRSVLLAISSTVLPGSGPKLTAMHKRTIQAPYTAAEIKAHTTWARGQTTALSRHRAMVLVAFCAGAGIHPGELRTLNRDDITIDNDGVVVRVTGRNSRLVPMLRDWEEWAARAVDVYPDTELLWGGDRPHGGKNMVNQFTSRTMGIAPAPARLRATWITTHLALGTPIKELIRAGGMARFENLDQYLAFVEGVPMAEHRAMLRGGDVR